MSVSPTATLAQALEPLRSDPDQSAVLLDVDGTLAPIVEHAEDAHVSEATRSLLIALTRRYALVGCVSGRRAQAARQMVAIGSIAYVGNHGGELLAAGATRPLPLDPALAEAGERVSAFAAGVPTATLRALRIRVEDKGLIVAFHWRGSPDEEAATAVLRELAQAAEAEGLAVHWGRKVLEVRPPVPLEKGRGIAALLADGPEGPGEGGPPFAAALYVGDDRTDVDAFRQLRAMVQSGTLGSAVCVAVGSEEAPPELIEQADVVVDGPGEVRGLLAALVE
jgi:trehalose 6-phosphate phosphatase